MKAKKSLLDVILARPWPLAGSLAIILALVLVAIDWFTWIELNESIVYSLPLVVAGAARRRRLLWLLVLFLASMTFVVYAMQIPPGVFSWREPFFVNRVLAVVTMVLMTGVLHVWTLAVDAMDEQRRQLQEQNIQLESANQELLVCKDQITQQNEELDRRRQIAEDASDRKTRLLASVSHDIRSPANAISVTTELLRRIADNPALSAEVPGLARRLQANAASLADLASDLLDISSLDARGVSLHESKFSLNDLLLEECLRLLSVAQAKQLRLESELPKPAVWLLADRVKLSRVVGNLVTNAIKFTETGSVTVSASLTPEQGLAIRVRDTGVGIAPEDLERIFDEFAQLRNPHHDNKKGWGLGLAICRRLVGAMGGKIEVESQPNRGSVFTVWLQESCVVDHSEGPSSRRPAELVAKK